VSRRYRVGTRSAAALRAGPRLRAVGPRKRLVREIRPRPVLTGKPTENTYVESFHGRFRDECLNASWFWNLFDARKKISAWRNYYNSARPPSAMDHCTPDELAHQWQSASLEEGNMAVAQPGQGDPDRLRFAPALTWLVPGRNISLLYRCA